MTKQELYKELLVQEHLLDTYSRIDADRTAQIQVKIRQFEIILLDILNNENIAWLLEQKEKMMYNRSSETESSEIGE